VFNEATAPLSATLNEPADQAQRKLEVCRSSAGNKRRRQRELRRFHQSDCTHVRGEARPAATFRQVKGNGGKARGELTSKITAYFLFQTQAARFTVISSGW
jgi:hypothetical protein